MKRSRIFLGATTALLAVAGIAAAKVHSFGKSITRYYCTGIPLTTSQKFKCVTLVNVANTTKDNNGSSIYRITYNGGLYTLYTNQSSSDQFCTVTTGSQVACHTPLTYSTND